MLIFVYHFVNRVQMIIMQEIVESFILRFISGIIVERTVFLQRLCNDIGKQVLCSYLELVVFVRVELIDWAMCCVYVKVAKVEMLTKTLQRRCTELKDCRNLFSYYQSILLLMISLQEKMQKENCIDIRDNSILCQFARNSS